MIGPAVCLRVRALRLPPLAARRTAEAPLPRRLADVFVIFVIFVASVLSVAKFFVSKRQSRD
jgi:hypothetical protein